MSKLKIRLAKPEDKQDVLKISATVWDGNDYIPDVWDRWIGEKPSAGFLLVALQDKQVVGVQHTKLQTGRIAWMEGIRVHPDYRNQGIGGELLAKAAELAIASGCHTSRLSTAESNQASQAVASKNGLQPIASFVRFTAPSLLAPPASLDSKVEARTVTSLDLARVRTLTKDESTLIADSWTALDVPQQMAPDRFEVGLVAGGGPDGLALATPNAMRGRLSLAYIGGTVEAVRSLGSHLRHVAQQFGVGSVEGWLRPTLQVDQGLTAAGFTQTGDFQMTIYERPLKAQ